MSNRFRTHSPQVTWGEGRVSSKYSGQHIAQVLSICMKKNGWILLYLWRESRQSVLAGDRIIADRLDGDCVQRAGYFKVLKFKISSLRKLFSLIFLCFLSLNHSELTGPNGYPSADLESRWSPMVRNLREKHSIPQVRVLCMEVRIFS